jgi:hypothetical protein
MFANIESYRPCKGWFYETFSSSEVMTIEQQTGNKGKTVEEVTGGSWWKVRNSYNIAMGINIFQGNIEYNTYL